MRIGIVSIMEGYPWGGSEELWYKMAIEALKDKHKVVISYKYWPELPEKLKKIEGKGAKLLLRNPKTKFPSILERVIGKIKGEMVEPERENPFVSLFESKPDLILINEGLVFNLLLFPGLIEFLKNINIPYYLLSHGCQEWGVLEFGFFQIGREIYKSASKCFFVSQRSINIVRRQLADDLNNSFVVRNPVNLDSIAYYLPYPTSSEPINLACVGRLSCKEKGYEILLNVISSERWLNRNFILNFYGEGPDKHFLKELVKYYRLDSKVSFKGVVKPTEIWLTNQILIQSSIREGMPLAVVEAMLAGRPVIATDVAGHTEWIENNREGFIANSPTVKEIDDAMERAWKQKNNWIKMGEKAREKALKLHDVNPGKTLLNLIINYP